MKRRILSILTALALCLSLCPTWAFAAPAAEEPEIIFTLDVSETGDETQTLTDGNISGTITFHKTERKLTLDGVSYAGNISITPSEFITKLTIEITGTNSVKKMTILPDPQVYDAELIGNGSFTGDLDTNTFLTIANDFTGTLDSIVRRESSYSDATMDIYGNQEISSPETIGMLTVAEGASLTLNNGGKLTIKEAGSLTVPAGASLTIADGGELAIHYTAVYNGSRDGTITNNGVVSVYPIEDTSAPNAGAVKNIVILASKKICQIVMLQISPDWPWSQRCFCTLNTAHQTAAPVAR